jgi:hypothetical protein
MGSNPAPTTDGLHVDTIGFYITAHVCGWGSCDLSGLWKGVRWGRDITGSGVGVKLPVVGIGRLKHRGSGHACYSDHRASDRGD